IPVIEGILKAKPEACISIDTTVPQVARAAVESGARIVNDVSMGASDALLAFCAERGVGLVLMHTRKDGRIDRDTTAYTDVLIDVRNELDQAIKRAAALGVKPEQIWIDPGLGFAKSPEQSMRLLAHLGGLKKRGERLLVGASRKFFLSVYGSASSTPEPPRERLGSSVGAALWAWLEGADALRVHDVRFTAQALRLFQALIALREEQA
ncbi:MAG: dihydropteroate synthase, partial [Deltaproteobacteria bacterium]|nr:dihydropteroate synthase [Deltaproteobacteria bacterium]